MIVRLCPDLPDHLIDLWFYHPDNETLKQLLDEAIEQLGIKINTIGGISLIECSLCPVDTIFLGSSHSKVFKMGGIAAEIAKDAEELENRKG